MKLRLPRRERHNPSCKITDSQGRVVYEGSWFRKGQRIWTKMLEPHLKRWWQEGGGP